MIGVSELTGEQKFRLSYGPVEHTRYVWRVTGYWQWGSAQRHYLTRRAAMERARLWLEGREAEDAYDHVNGHTEVVSEITPATKVTISKSEPVRFGPDEEVRA